MRTSLLLLGACVVSCTPAPRPTPPAPAALREPSLEYSGVYMSTAEEDYFSPCGVEGAGEGWSLRFRDGEREAPFLKRVTAVRGFPPLTHFIRVRGRLGAPGSYNVGFQTRQLAVDSVLDVREKLEPCAGFGVPAGWIRLPAGFRNSKGIAMSLDRRRVAVMDSDGGISIWSTETGARVRQLGSVPKGELTWETYGPMAFSDDGTLLAAGGTGGIVRVWRARDGKRIFSLALKDSAAVAREMAKIPPRADAPGYRQPLPPNSYTPARQIAFNKRATMLATTNVFSTIVWSMTNGKKLAEFPVGTDFNRQVFFTSSDGLLMTIDNGRMTARASLDAAPVTLAGARALQTGHVAISPDRRTIAMGVTIDSVLLLSLAGFPARVLHVPGFVPGVTAFSPDGNAVAIAGGSAGLYLYDMRTGAPIRSFQNFQSSLSGAWFSADGKSIVTISTFDDRFRVVYVDPAARPATQPIFDDSLTVQLPLGPPPSTSPRTISGIVTGPNQRAVANADVAISNGDAPDSIVSRATTSSGGYFSFNGIRFRHVVLRVRAPGFAPAVKYIHVNRWDSDGPWGIEMEREAAGGND